MRYILSKERSVQLGKSFKEFYGKAVYQTQFPFANTLVTTSMNNLF